MHTFEQMFEHALQFLSNPWKLWKSGNLIAQRTVLRLAFAEQITFARNEGLRTPKTTLPFKVLEGFSCQKKIMADEAGIRTLDRLLTYAGFQDRCIQPLCQLSVV